MKPRQNVRFARAKESKLICEERTAERLIIADIETKMQVHFDILTNKVVEIVYPWKNGFEPEHKEQQIYYAFDRIVRGMKRRPATTDYERFVPAMQELCNKQAQKLIASGQNQFDAAIINGEKLYTITAEQ